MEKADETGPGSWVINKCHVCLAWFPILSCPHLHAYTTSGRLAQPARPAQLPHLNFTALVQLRHWQAFSQRRASSSSSSLPSAVCGYRVIPLIFRSLSPQPHGPNGAKLTSSSIHEERDRPTKVSPPLTLPSSTTSGVITPAVWYHLPTQPNPTPVRYPIR